MGSDHRGTEKAWKGMPGPKVESNGRREREDEPVVKAYEFVYGRLPTSQEREDTERYMMKASLVDLCHALLISNEFVYVR